MNKKTFISVIEAHQHQNDLLDVYEDLINIDSPLINFGWEMFETLMAECFSEEDRDVIYWWLYERISHNGEILRMYDCNDNEIKMDTPEDLWNYLTDFEPECQTCTNS